MQNRLENFRNNKEAMSMYRQAIRLLQDSGVDQILLELSAADYVDPSHPQALQMAASHHYERLGYQKCLADLLNLESVVAGTAAVPVADYGAIDRMLERGDITPEQAEKLRLEN